MQGMLFYVGMWIMVSAVARILVGAGLGIGTYVVIEPLFNEWVGHVLSNLSGLLPAAAQILWMAGFGVALSAVLSGLSARIAIQAAQIFIGKSN